jgi:hypothetical protein
VVAHARDACASAQPFLSPTGVVVVPRRCKAHFFGEAGARLQPCMAWLQRLAGASEPPASLRDACIAAAARAAACMPIEPCATLATHSVDALLRSLQDAAADGSWQRDGLLLLRAHAQLGLPSAELAAYVRTGCAAACAGAPTLLGEVFTQALPAQMWSPLAASPDGFAPGMASPAQLATLAARVDACIDAAWTALRGALATAAPGLDRAQFAEALLDAAAAEGCPMAALYAPMAPCELLNSGRRPTLLDTRALPRVTHALDDSDDDTVEVEPAAAIGAPLHPLAGASLSLRDGGLLGRRGHAHAGTSLPVAILSSAAACTPMHVEDWLFASYNAHLHGAPKVWYVVPTAAADAFVAAVRDRGSLPPSRRPLAAALLATKRLRAELPPEVLRELGVRRVVQQPGDIVLTAPVRPLHNTCECIVRCASRAEQRVATRRVPPSTGRWPPASAWRSRSTFCLAAAPSRMTRMTARRWRRTRRPRQRGCARRPPACATRAAPCRATWRPRWRTRKHWRRSCAASCWAIEKRPRRWMPLMVTALTEREARSAAKMADAAPSRVRARNCRTYRTPN